MSKVEGEKKWEKKEKDSTSWFRSKDLWVMSPTRFLCAKVLLPTTIFSNTTTKSHRFVQCISPPFVMKYRVMKNNLSSRTHIDEHIHTMSRLSHTTRTQTISYSTLSFLTTKTRQQTFYFKPPYPRQPSWLSNFLQQAQAWPGLSGRAKPNRGMHTNAKSGHVWSIYLMCF